MEDREEDGRATQQQGKTEKVAAAGRKLDIHQQAADADDAADTADAGADL